MASGLSRPEAVPSAGVTLTAKKMAAFWIRFLASKIRGVIPPFTTAATVAYTGGVCPVPSWSTGIIHTVGLRTAKGATLGKANIDALAEMAPTWLAFRHRLLREDLSDEAARQALTAGSTGLI